MQRHRVVREVGVIETPRLKQVSGIFDVPLTAKSRQCWNFDFDLPDEWSVGLIVGPSGCGKTTIARHLWPDSMVGAWDWPADKSVLDGFPKAMGIKDVVELLSSVGFSTPPAWIRPFHALSNGEQFRVNLARTLAESKDLAVVDEFSSVVDRQVAQVASAAVAKTVRRKGQRLVAVSCHADILEWLDPDWVFQPFAGVVERRSLQGRPKLEMEVYKADRDVWDLFKPHHYLSADLHTASHCFVGLIDGKPIAFNSYLHFPHPKVRDIKIGHRLVVLPDYQGLGIGGKFEAWLGQYLYERGMRYHNITAHPALIAQCNRSPRWKLTRDCDRLQTGKTSKLGGGKSIGQMKPRRLATYTFEYLPIRTP